MFLKYYLSEKIDGKKNPCFLSLELSGEKVGFTKQYSLVVLRRIAEQERKEGSEVVKKSLVDAYEEAGINSEWITGLIQRLGEKNDKRVIDKKLVNTGDPDAHAAKTALEFVAKTQGLYEDEQHNHKFDGLSAEDLIKIISSRIGGDRRSD